MSPLWKLIAHRKQSEQSSPSPEHPNAKDPVPLRESEQDGETLPGGTPGAEVEETSLHFFRGSMTVEAALVLPLFLFFFLNLGSVIELLRLHANLETALQSAGRNVALYGAMATDPFLEMGRTGHASPGGITPEEEEESAGEAPLLGEIGDLAVTGLYVRQSLISELGADYLDTAPILGGAGGLSFLESEVVGSGDLVDLVVTWQTKAPFPGPFFSFRMSSRYYAHLWNGYEVKGEQTDLQQERIVYITADSEVYHVTTACTHLKLTVRVIGAGELESARNAEGARYYPCEFCTGGEMPEDVYVAREGRRFHYSGTCKGLTRSYTPVPLSEVEDSHRPCSRCGK